jgi:hypothetical protein
MLRDRDTESSALAARKKTAPGERTFQALRSRRVIPERCYSSDKPNPNLRRFVEENVSPVTVYTSYSNATSCR